MPLPITHYPMWSTASYRYLPWNKLIHHKYIRQNIISIIKSKSVFISNSSIWTYRNELICDKNNNLQISHTITSSPHYSTMAFFPPPLNQFINHPIPQSFNAPPSIYRQLFQEILETFSDPSICYTDGSKIHNETTFAFTIENSTHVFRHRNFASVFTSELQAIFNAYLFYIPPHPPNSSS